MATFTEDSCSEVVVMSTLESPEAEDQQDEPKELEESEKPEEPEELKELEEPKEPEESEEPEEPGTPSSPCDPSESLEALIEQRIQKLHNRCFVLQQMQRFIRKTEDSEGITEQTTGDNDEDVSELERVEKELEELMHQKENLGKDNANAAANGGQVSSSRLSSKIETHEGGIYTLPPLLFTPADVPLPPVQTTLDFEPLEVTVTPPVPKEPIEPEKPQLQDEDIIHIEPTDHLGQAGAFTLCPSCDALVFTQTSRVNGESVWLVCCICTMLGGFAGLCFVPFCVDRLKSVQHKCPECQAVIYTFNPF